jgi:peptide/nickel transport system permease protein
MAETNGILGEKYYLASQWQLMWIKFRKHRLAIIGSTVLVLLYVSAIFCQFLAPYDIYRRHSGYIFAPPQRIRFFDREGRLRWRPFVYGLKGEMDPDTWRRTFQEDTSEIYPIRFFVRGDEYKFWNLFKTSIHLFGVDEPGVVFLFGTDDLARCLFSRNLHAARTSLSVGLIGVFVSFILGATLGGISGYYGGGPDMLIQRAIEFLLSIPRIPLWMALAAALPADWPVVRVYFGITIVLSVLGWPQLARVVRGKLLELREEDFVIAARIAGASDGYIIARHLLPRFASYLIVSLTLAIPSMILGETSLSFLGVGLRPPAVSWGVLLHEGQNVQSIAHHPWLLITGLFIIVTVLAFNFLGDGLRDAADPYR